MPNVEIKKVQPRLDNIVDVEVFPGKVHKPVVTFVNQDNFQWGEVEEPREPPPPEPCCIQEDPPKQQCPRHPQPQAKACAKPQSCPC